MRMLLLCLVLPLGGCSLLHSGGPTEVLASPSQILYLPKVQLPRPELEIHKLAEPVHADQVVKAYVATVYQLIRYSEDLERLVDQLQQLHIEDYP